MARSSDRRLRAPFRLIAPLVLHVVDHISTVSGFIATTVNTVVDKIVDGRNSAYRSVSTHPYVKAITSAAVKAEATAENTARPYVEPVLGAVRPVRPYLPGVFLAIIAVLLPPAIVTCCIFVFVTAPFWIPFLFLTAILWIPFVIFLVGAFLVVNFVILVRVMSSKAVQSRLNSAYNRVMGSGIVQGLLYDAAAA